jgi:hypothetical protein
LLLEQPALSHQGLMARIAGRSDCGGAYQIALAPRSPLRAAPQQAKVQQAFRADILHQDAINQGDMTC